MGKVVIGPLMIGIDTNVVIRILARDNPNQHEAAVALVRSASSASPLVVNPIVVAESMWVLERSYGLKATEARSLMLQLLGSRELLIPDQLRFENWQSWFASSHRNFSDVVIAAMNLENGCEFTYTFDQRAAKSVPGMELLK